MRKIMLQAGLLLAFGLAQNEARVEVVAHTWRIQDGFLKVAGELRNPYREALCFVEVNFRYLDEKGQPIEVERFTAREAGWMPSDGVMADRDVVPPGETSSFYRSRDLTKLKTRPVQVEIRAYGLRLRSMPTTAALSEVGVEKTGSNFRVRGFYTASGQPARNPSVVAVGYDAAGKPLISSRVYFTQNGSALRQAVPGQRYPFSLLLSGETGAVQQVRAYPSWECE
ncbi:hypothetical protein DV704_09310 [Meiothermus sp. QL-1]|uniref:hypothetical protein n=1 Tax=Meiothermus sp. QL-1 TaxID=2058095 RepID=UPI000E0C12C8|nr:hypothetical protein [Meiothermus sp. QL-1]RDI95048.1 hypothetical protein DV704_09310 [Meiothermus sp. QL-1]